MQDPQEQIIAHNTRELRQFIFDLAGDTLDKAGYPAEAYAFHLHVAFRRNMILDPLVLDLPVKLQDKKSRESLRVFAQKLVDEVEAAQNDCWALRLIKTEYLSYLDKNRNASEHALKLLTDMLHSDLNASRIVSADENLQKYIELLQANIHFCDILITLPFILEKTCQTLSKNTGINYDTRKSAALLTAMLDSLNLHLDQNSLVAMLKFAVNTVMPGLPLDDDSIAVIQEQLLPLVNRLTRADVNLTKAKNALLSDQGGVARRSLLAAMGVRFDSVKTILLQTLLKPVEHAANAAYGLEGFVLAAFQAFERGPGRLDYIVNAFSSFDNFVSNAHPLQHPGWLHEANDYYQTFHEKGRNLKEGLRQGLGLFYTRLISFIPASVLGYFRAASDIEQVLGGSCSEADVHLVYLDFYMLSQSAELEEGLEAHFFEAYMMDVYKTLSRDFNFETYLAFKKICEKKALKKALSLTALMQPEDNLDLLFLIHALKQQETSLLIKTGEGVLRGEDMADLLSALDYQAEDPRVQRFQDRFLKPAIERLMLDYLRNKYQGRLENLIDNPDLTDNLPAAAHYDQLEMIYSLLVLGKGISLEHFTLLEDIFGRDPVSKAVKRLLLKSAEPVEIQNTPRQSTQANIKKYALPQVQILTGKILSDLNKQYEACKNLASILCDSSLRILCENKMAYIEQIKAILNRLSRDLKNDPDKIAGMLSRLRDSHGLLEQGKKDLLETPVKGMINQLMRFAWYVYPDGKADNTLFNNILSHYFKDTELLSLYKADQAFRKTLAHYPNAVFMDVINHPLTITHFIPDQERVMDGFLEAIIKQGGSFLEGRYIDQFLAALPYPFLAPFVKTLLESGWLQRQAQGVILEFAGVYTENAKAKIRNILYPVLGIRLQHSVEESAMQYVLYPGKCAARDMDAYALYYLQYRSIKDHNPKADPEAFIALLFPSLEKSGEYDLRQVIDAFENTDRQLFSGENNLEKDLHFLIRHLDFSDSRQDLKIRLIMLNKFLLLAFDASEQLYSPDLERQGIDLMQALLKKMPDRKGMESALLAPAINRGSAITGQRLSAKLDSLVSQLEGSLRNRQSLKNFLQPHFGQTVLEVEYAKAAGNNPHKIYKVLSFLGEIFLTAGNWAILLAAIQASIGGMQSIYLFLGVAGAFGVAATQAGLAVLALVFIASFLIKFAGEIYSYRQEFIALSDEKYSLMERVGWGALYVLVCLTTALSMTFMMDFIWAKVAKYLPLGSFGKLWKALRVYPEAEALAEEERHLFGLKIKLNTLKMQLQEGRVSSDICTAARAQMLAIEGQLNQASQKEMGIFQEQYQQELTAFRNAFTELDALLKGMETFKTMMTVTANSGEIPSEAIKTPWMIAEKPRVDMDQYCQKRYMKSDEPEPGLLSGFYVWLEKIGQYISWRRPVQAEIASETTLAEVISVSSWEKSAILMSGSHDQERIETGLTIASTGHFEDSFFKSLVIVDPAQHPFEDSLLGFEEICASGIEEGRSLKL